MANNMLIPPYIPPRRSYNIRSKTHRPPVRHELRVVRSVEQNQPQLFQALELLEANTSHLVDYKKIGKLGVTLVMLEPVLRKIIPKNRNGNVRREDLQLFESELRDNLKHAQYANYDIGLEWGSQLGLYGKRKNRLGLKLDSQDYRLVGDRAVIEEYICDNYYRANGEPVDERFLERNLHELSPHITIGEVQYGNFPHAERQAMRQLIEEDTTSFMLNQAYDQMQRDEHEYGSPFRFQPIAFPESVSLGGLQVFCQQRD